MSATARERSSQCANASAKRLRSFPPDGHTTFSWTAGSTQLVQRVKGECHEKTGRDTKNLLCSDTVHHHQHIAAIVSTQRSKWMQSITLSRIHDWDRFDIFEVAAAAPHAQLFEDLFTSVYVANGESGDAGYALPPKVSSLLLRQALSEAEATYSDPITKSSGAPSRNPYHNALHGADAFCTVMALLPCLSERWVAPGTFTPLVTLAIGVATLLHDYRHVGVNNAHLIQTQHPIAMCYCDDSVLERLHAASALQLLHRHRVLSGLSAPERADFRRMALHAIVATDFSSGLRTTVALEAAFPSAFTAMNAAAATADSAAESGGENAVTSKSEAAMLRLRPETIQTVVNMLVQCADVAHPTKALQIHQRWSVLITEEFYAQGRLDAAAGLPVSPLCDSTKGTGSAWGRSQIGFLKYVVTPKFNALAAICTRASGVRWTQSLGRSAAFWASDSPDCCFDVLTKRLDTKDSAFIAARRDYTAPPP